MEAYRQHIDHWLATSICEPAEAKATCPMWAILKPGGLNELRFVTDLRARNKITKDEWQPLINQELMRETAARARFVSKFDMRDSYFQTIVEEQYEDNNSINTPLGIFKVRVVMMGDKRSPATLT